MYVPSFLQGVAFYCILLFGNFVVAIDVRQRQNFDLVTENSPHLFELMFVIACKNKFAATIAAIKTKKANPTEWEAIKEGFRNQTRYKTLWNYAFAVIYPTIS